MSDEGREPELDEGEGGDDDEGEHLDAADVRELLRAAMKAPEPPRTTGARGGTKGAQETLPPDILRGVQKKLRARSKGKFYGDGWSTSRSPRSTYLVTSLLMLVLIALVFFVLIPWGGSLVAP